MGTFSVPSFWRGAGGEALNISMKIIKTIFAAMAAVALVASCEKQEPSSFYSIQVALPHTGNYPIGYKYANEYSDSLKFLSYSPWKIEQTEGDEGFVTINGQTSGKGNMIVSYGVTLSENTTGKSRFATYQIVDSEDASRAKAAFRYIQFATRQDGALGNAAEVKNISGSDGSNIDITYDLRHRPLTISMSAGDMKREITFAYDDNDNTVTATQSKYEFSYADTLFTYNNVKLNGSYMDRFLPNVNNYIYQPRMLMTLDSNEASLVNTFNDTRSNTKQAMAYQAFSNNGYEYSFANGFMVKNSIGNKFAQAIGVYYNGKSKLDVDSIYKADSIGVERIYSDHKHKSEMYKLSFSNISNRMTTVDANQLMEGVANCDPYLLLSFYKLARQSYVFSKAEGKKGARYTFDTKANADGSIKTLAVTDINGNKTTYTFSY